MNEFQYIGGGCNGSDDDFDATHSHDRRQSISSPIQYTGMCMKLRDSTLLRNNQRRSSDAKQIKVSKDKIKKKKLNKADKKTSKESTAEAIEDPTQIQCVIRKPEERVEFACGESECG